MASVELTFQAPDDPDLAKLLIFQSPIQDGLFSPVEEVTDIGTYPNYISEYTSNLVASPIYWFTIKWEDTKGAQTPPSVAVQGGTTTLVAKLVSRVLMRDSSLSPGVVAQTAEWVVAMVMKTDDPYSIGLSPTLRQLEGMTLLALARSMLNTLAQESSDESYTAGLVSQKSSTSIGSSRQKLIEWLLGQANGMLGLSLSTIMLMADIDPLGIGTESSINFDQSRLALNINFQ